VLVVLEVVDDEFVVDVLLELVEELLEIEEEPDDESMRPSMSSTFWRYCSIIGSIISASKVFAIKRVLGICLLKNLSLPSSTLSQPHLASTPCAGKKLRQNPKHSRSQLGDCSSSVRLRLLAAISPETRTANVRRKTFINFLE